MSTKESLYLILRNKCIQLQHHEDDINYQYQLCSIVINESKSNCRFQSIVSAHKSSGDDPTTNWFNETPGAINQRKQL
ncbi:MAG: hypothetical protein GY755_08120 [Chloroflexi bacterium]|nr:hypothetical protein [Chloroflexota bacterium]